MIYLPEFIHRLLIHLCFLLIILGFILSFDWLNTWFSTETSFHAAQICFLIPSVYFAFNLISNLVQSDKTLMFEEMESEKVIYTIGLRPPNLTYKVLKIALMPLIGGLLIYVYLLSLDTIPYGLTILIGLFTIFGSLPALKELLVKPFRVYVTESGIFYFWLDYEEILWSELESAHLQNTVILFRNKAEADIGFELGAITENPVFFMTVLKSQLSRHNISHNLEEIEK
ncbi:MAG: hypothetical protein KDD99_06645 [Bacteroidetes bacterium]|nr:hypothetical protein [Bacteroidota bacterium]